MRNILKPFSWIYGCVVNIRHWMFDVGILKQKEYKIPIICIGNLTVGGTGKTPMCEFFVQNLKRKYNIAILSRGYKRKTKGYLEAEVGSSFLKVGDEVKQMKLKFPDIVVAVCESRVKGIDTIMQRHPEVNLVILDDAFQHRYVEPWVSVLLIDYTRPVFDDCFLPAGRLRDSTSQIKKAHFIIVTKTPRNINQQQMRMFVNRLEKYPFQKVFFSYIDSQNALALHSDAVARELLVGSKIIAMAGIGNPAPFLSDLKKRYEIVGQMLYADHHPYRMIDLKRMKKALEAAPDGTVIVTTEKDAVKLMNAGKIPKMIRERLYYVPINMAFIGGGDRELLFKTERYVEENQKYQLLH